MANMAKTPSQAPKVIRAMIIAAVEPAPVLVPAVEAMPVIAQMHPVVAEPVRVVRTVKVMSAKAVNR